MGPCLCLSWAQVKSCLCCRPQNRHVSESRPQPELRPRYELRVNNGDRYNSLQCRLHPDWNVNHWLRRNPNGYAEIRFDDWVDVARWSPNPIHEDDWVVMHQPRVGNSFDLDELEEYVEPIPPQMESFEADSGYASESRDEDIFPIWL